MPDILLRISSLPSTSTEERPWRALLASYQQPDDRRAAVELVLTLVPLIAIWAGGWAAASAGLWPLALLLAVPSAGFIVRLFMIQHDCGHQAFFRSSALNNWIGRFAGVLTLTPYDFWRREHALHHATSGNLDRRGAGSIDTLTVAEYRKSPALARLGYRLYRNPFVLFLLGPVYVFFIRQRLPMGQMREGWRPWVSVLGTNLALTGLLASAIWFGGWRALLFVYLPSMTLAGSLGVWLFYVQHQFEGTQWARDDAWNHTRAALTGSSYYVLPPVLNWLSANIGVHHVHHIASRVPFYRIPEVLADHADLAAYGRITLLDSLRTVKLALWDEEHGKMVSFAAARQARAQRATQPSLNAAQGG